MDFFEKLIKLITAFGACYISYLIIMAFVSLFVMGDLLRDQAPILAFFLAIITYIIIKFEGQGEKLELLEKEVQELKEELNSR